MKTGTIKSFSLNSKYGFIKPDEENAKDVFVHLNELKKSGIENLTPGQNVKYELNTKDTKVFATRLELI